MMNPEQARQAAIEMERNAILDGVISLAEAKRDFPLGFAALTKDEYSRLVVFHADVRHKRWDAVAQYRQRRHLVKLQQPKRGH